VDSTTKKTSSNWLNWLIDVVAFALFFVVSAPQSTDIPIHEWLSFVFFGTFIVHIVVHWRWIIDVTKRLIKKLPGETRFNHLWDVIIFVMMVVVMFTGVLISEVALPALGVPMEIDPFWNQLHDLSANLLLIMLGIHLAMHWDWIVSAFKRYVLQKSAP